MKCLLHCRLCGEEVIVVGTGNGMLLVVSCRTGSSLIMAGPFFNSGVKALAKTDSYLWAFSC